ncbi:MAG: hypothetical protein CMI60_06950 [Parvibaculum sp.]|nr:hypothetical protein [Parvibaculum sp.]
MWYASDASKLDKSPSARGFTGNLALFVPEQASGVKRPGRQPKRMEFQGFVVAAAAPALKMPERVWRAYVFPRKVRCGFLSGNATEQRE